MGTSRPLGDAPGRSYVGKLEKFARFAQPELRRIFADFELPADSVVLDLGCGAGLATSWLREAAGAGSEVVALDLSRPHLLAARAVHAGPLVQADAARTPFRDGSFDLVWSCNTINHLADPPAALRGLKRILRPGARMALAQSGFLPEMYFAWDAHLDDSVRRACHATYREQYGLATADTAGIRGLLALLQAAGYIAPRARTYVIERTQPLAPADRDYLLETVFRGYWGEKIGPHLSAADREALHRNCDPASPEFCLRRADFHHIQTLTVCVAQSPGAEGAHGGV